MNKKKCDDLLTICFAKFEFDIRNLLFEFSKFVFFRSHFRYISKQFVVAYSKFSKSY